MSDAVLRDLERAVAAERSPANLRALHEALVRFGLRERYYGFYSGEAQGRVLRYWTPEGAPVLVTCVDRDPTCPEYWPSDAQAVGEIVMDRFEVAWEGHEQPHWYEWHTVPLLGNRPFLRDAPPPRPEPTVGVESWRRALVRRREEQRAREGDRRSTRRPGGLQR